MKLLATVAICLVAAGGMLVATVPKGALPDALSIEDLRQRPVIGELGVPLGTVAEVTATIISADSLRNKSDSGAYLLRIDSVDGSVLAKPPIMRFQVHQSADVELFDGAFLNRESFFGKTNKLDSSQRAEQQKGFVNHQFKLVVYETGSFTGTPTSLFEDFLGYADAEFRFATSLVVLNQRD